MSELMWKVSSELDPDYIMPIDADEFINSSSRKGFEEELKNISLENGILIPWQTYIPTKSDQSSEINPLIRINKRRVQEEPQRYKVIVSKNFHRGQEFGSHGLVSEKLLGIGYVKLQKNFLSHFPVRSKLQIKKKVSLGFYACLATPNFNQRYSHQWRSLYDTFKANHFNDEKIDLEEISNLYASTQKVEIVSDPFKIDESIQLKYSDNIQNHSFETILSYFIEDLIAKNLLSF